MTNGEVLIVDYGLGNLASVATAVRAAGHSAAITDSVGHVRSADSIILPGVGAFPVAMKLLTESGLGQAVKEAVHHGAKLLGICLGMQLLFEASTEFGGSEGLALIPGEVKAIVDPIHPPMDNLRQTHIGWRELSMSDKANRHPLFEDIAEQSSFYFVHSYAAHPTVKESELATVSYGATKIVAACAQERILGVQFHPEKSGDAGLTLLRNFVAQ